MNEPGKVDLGTVKIHKEVLAEIVQSALEEIGGVSLVERDLNAGLLGLLRIRKFPGIDVHVDKSNHVNLEVKVRIRYGLNIPDMARQIQEAVRQAIERTADIDLKDVNVNIQGIERGKT